MSSLPAARGRYPLAAVEEALPGRTRRDHPLGPMTAYKVGGNAQLFVEPETPEEVAELLRLVHGEGIPLFVLGGGTNLLVRDGGVRGVVLHLGRAFRNVTVAGDDLTAGAIAPMSKVALAAERASLDGLVWGYDIPGTVGGGLRMNAGAHGGEMKDVLYEARGCDIEGGFHHVRVAEIRFAYRTAIYPTDLVFTEAVFRLRPGDGEKLALRRQENHAQRQRTQPKGHSVGSIFVNPPGDYAGRLVEAAGLKGFRIGGAVVSDKHANWILNEGGASASDIETMIHTVQARVRERFGVDLKPELKIVGEPGTE
jgi:UDP-N-acetylmuramate dehydrogenase